jgi:hypothetical protein
VCRIYVVSKGGNEEDITPTMFGGNTMLWHQILGHIEEKGLQSLHGKGMYEGMFYYTLYFDFYEQCIYGKQNRVRISSGATREKGILELIYNDVFRPMHVPSLSKYVHYVSL